MSVKVEKLETNVVELEFEVSKEDFESAMQRSYIKNVKSINIPGFRKGNIRNLLQRKAHQLTAVGIDLNSIKTQKHPIRFNRIPAFFKI